MNCATENKVIALILKYPSMEKLLDNVSDEMLQEMIECYELEFPEPLDFKNLARVCALLNCQPGDLIEYVQENN